MEKDVFESGSTLDARLAQLERQHPKGSFQAISAKSDLFGQDILEREIIDFDQDGNFDYEFTKKQTDALIAYSRADIASIHWIMREFWAQMTKFKYVIRFIYFLLILVIGMQVYIIVKII